MKKTNRTFPKKRIPLIVLTLLTVSLLCCSCQQGTKSLYLRSSRAGGSGEKSNVVDITIPHQSVQVTDPNTVTVTVGLGGDMKISAHETQTAVLKIEAEGCLINGVEDLYERNTPTILKIRISAPRSKNTIGATPLKPPIILRTLRSPSPRWSAADRSTLLCTSKKICTRDIPPR